jgi:hypothetical protein
LHRRRSFERLTDTAQLIEAELARDALVGAKVEGEPGPPAR